MPRNAVEQRSVRRLPDGRAAGPVDDAVVVEEPLEVRVAGDVVAVTMRTPGDDVELAIGFLHAEGIVATVDDIVSAMHCDEPDAPPEAAGNVIDVILAGDAPLSIDRLIETRRLSVTSSACGVCGRRSIDDLIERAGRVPDGPIVDEALVAGSTARLQQPTFEATGGSHAAVALGADGTVLAGREDIGRHNAVDKVVGALVKAKLIGAATGKPIDAARRPTILAVSGRASFEIIQKAAVARIPIVASVSAASSLAIDLAHDSGVTLAGFVRDGSLVVYTHPERLAPATRANEEKEKTP